MMMKPIIAIIATVLLCSNVKSFAQNDTPLEVLINIANQNERFPEKQLFTIDKRDSEYLDSYLRKYQTIRLENDIVDEILENDTEFLRLLVPTPNGGDFDLKLVNFDIRSENFKVYEQSNGVKNEIEVPNAKFFRGIVERGSDAQAGISVFKNEAFGLFSTLENGNVVIAKDPIKPGKFNQNYIVYFEHDLLFDREPKCGSDELKPFDQDESIDISRSNVFESCDDVEIEIEATYRLYSKKGGSVATMNYINAFFNNVSIIYRNEGIYTSIASIVINTSTDVYHNLTSSFNKLNKYGETIKNTYQNSGAELAHLVDVSDSNMGGIAWINAMCTNYYYFSSQDYHYGSYAYSDINETHQNFPDYSLTVFMFSHEMGHNLGSKHTQWCGWEGGAIDDCTAVEGGSCEPGPTPTNGGTIMSYCHQVPTVGINYSEGFGVQPGNKIRTTVQEKTCDEEYTPNAIVSNTPNLTITANRECTDSDGWTNYFYDNNSASESDDILLLSVNKNNENIGNLDDGTLTVQIKTSSSAGSGSTHIGNPGYSANEDWHVMNRWFELVPTNEPTNPVTVRFPYTSGDFDDVMDNQPEIQNHTDLMFYKISNPGDPNPDQGHTNVTNSQINFYENAAVSSLTEWKYINSGGGSHIAEFQVNSFSGGGGGFSMDGLSLPVELTSFKAQKVSQFSELSWETSSEVNNDYYTVERSVDGKEFVEIGRVKGVGDSQEASYYSFIDRSPETGINYYRLKQTDYNGVYEYLGIRQIEFERTSKVNVFPNPLHNEDLNLDIEVEKGGSLSISVINVAGERIMQIMEPINKGNNRVVMNLGELDAGIYFIQSIHNGELNITKLIKD